MKTYLFYDTETTGLNVVFDQIVQFAAIRTDENFQELERYEIYIKMNPDVVPSPKAFLTHKIAPNFLADKETEYSAMQKIYNIINTPETINIGYNNLGFDDEILRFSFYRNLLPAYNHQYLNSCYRMDLYPLTLLFFLYREKALNWPIIDGQNSFKLENLSKANNFVLEGAAHNALVDVLATLALAKKLRGSDESFWNYVSAYFQKNTDLKRLNKVPDVGIMIDASFSLKQNFQAIVYPLGVHYHYKNQLIYLILSTLDWQTENFNYTDPQLIFRKKAGDLGFILPMKDRFFKNKQKQELAQKNWLFLKENPRVFENIKEHFLSYKYPEVENVDDDAKLYIDKFFTPEEEALCQKFHAASLEEKIILMKNNLANRLGQKMARILGRNYPGIQLASQENIFDYRGHKKLTFLEAQRELLELAKGSNSLEESVIINQLQKYYETKLSENKL